MFDDDRDDQKKRTKTTVEILKSPDQYEGKDTALHMSEMEELVKQSANMSEFVVRTLNLIRIRLSFIEHCDDCFNPDWKAENKKVKYCCEKKELEDKIKNMDIPKSLWSRRKEFPDTAQESLQFFHNDVAGDLAVIDSRLVWILSREPYNIIERRDYSVEKLMRRYVWEKLKAELEDVDIEDLKAMAEDMTEPEEEQEGDE